MDGPKIRCICLVAWCSLWLQSCVSVSIKTQFTLLTNPMTWNEAKLACQNIDKTLAKVDTYLKQTYIDQYMTTEWSADMTGDLWIGLHESDTAQPGLVKWSDCTDVLWNSYATGEPSSAPDDKLCFAIAGVSNWISYRCGENLQAICQSTPGDCTFDSYPGKGCSHGISQSVELDWDACLADCLTDTLNTGAECWAVGHWNGYAGNDCWKFYTVDDPDICINNMYTNNAIDVGVKICFESDTNSAVVTVAPNTYPDTACFVVYTTTTELTTVDLTTTPITTTTTTTSTTSTTTPIPTTTTTTPATSTTTPIPTTTTTTAVSTTTTTAAGTPTPTTGVCSCTCNMLNTSLLNLQEELKKLKLLLTVNKTSTSLYKRRFISVMDDRVSATSIGYMGVTLLVLTFGIIIVLDFPVLVLHIKGLCRCKSKHRVTCA